MHAPARRDVLRELADACRRRGMRLGLYYSNPDWHHPNARNPLSTHQVPPEEGDVPDLAAYREYVKAQITELLTNYGEIVCLFWDIPTHVPAPEMNALVRRLQPGILIDDRGWGPGGDYSTPERNVPDGAAFTNLTEACDSVGARSWGFRLNEDYRTLGYVTRAIDRTLSRGGNFLLNVGPRADGSIPEQSLDLLRRTGVWYRKVRESYRGVAFASELAGQEGALATRRGNTVYLHFPKGLAATGVNARPISARPTSAVLLNTCEPVAAEMTVLPCDWKVGTPALHLFGLPADDLANETPVIRLDFPDAPAAPSPHP